MVAWSVGRVGASLCLGFLLDGSGLLVWALEGSFGVRPRAGPPGTAGRILLAGLELAVFCAFLLSGIGGLCGSPAGPGLGG